MSWTHLVIEHKSCPTGEISQLQKPESKTDRFRMQILRAHLHASGCAGQRRVHAAEACRLRTARHAGCASQDAPGARRKARQLRAGRRAGCAPGDAPVARRKTRGLHAGRRAGCTPEDVRVARRKTCGLHAGRRAGCTPEDVPVARRKTCRERAVCAPSARRVRAQAGRAVRFGLSLLARVSQSSAVGPRFSFRSRKKAERSTQRSETRRFESLARARVQVGRLLRETLSPSRNTHKGNSNKRQSFPERRPLLSRFRKNALTRPNRDQGGMDDFWGVSESSLFFKREAFCRRIPWN